VKSVPAREANQRFSKLLAEAASGEEIVITRRGTPVAKLVPATTLTSEAERDKAIERMIELMRKGLRLGGRKFTRDEMHEP
jgi:prevent-host-death family protein